MSENHVENHVAFIPGRNGGRLRNGGTNRGGAGRTPNVLRDKMRGTLAKRMKIAELILVDPDSTNADKLRALDFLAKYGLGTTNTQTDVEGNDAPRPFTFRIDSPNGDGSN